MHGTVKERIHRVLILATSFTVAPIRRECSAPRLMMPLDTGC